MISATHPDVGKRVRIPELWGRERTGTITGAGMVQARRRGRFGQGRVDVILVQLDTDLDWPELVSLDAARDDWEILPAVIGRPEHFSQEA